MITFATASWVRRSAAEGPPPRLEKVEEVVVTGTRTPERSQRATVKTDAVSRDEVERRGATNVAEVLSTQPGVRVDPGAYGHLGGVGAIQIQGFDLQRVLVLEDGEPVVGDIGGAIDLSAIPTADVERIEIVTGPTSSLYGSNAIGGVVNIITAPPHAVGPAGRTRAEARTRNALALQGHVSYRRGKSWIGLDGDLFRRDGIARTPGVPDLHLPDTSRIMLGARGGTAIAKNIDLRVRTRWIGNRLDGLSSQLAPGLGRYLLDQPSETDRFTIHLVENIAFARGSNLRLTLGRQWVDTATASIQRGSSIGDRRQRHQRMQSAEAIGTVADGRRTWVVGSRAEVEHIAQTLETTESLSSGITTRSEQELVPQTLGRAALYGQLQWRVGDLFTVLAGARGETDLRFGSAITPRLAASCRPVQEMLVRFSLGRGFRAPTAKELGFLFDHSSIGYRVLGNAALRPETSWGANGDVTLYPTRQVILRGGAFMNWVRDLIDVDLAGGSASGAVVDYRYQNFGKARTIGAQISGSFRVGERFRAQLGYDYLFTRNDIADRPLGGRPPHTLTTSVHSELLWGIAVDMRWRTSTDVFVSETLRGPGYTTVDLRLAREVWPRSQAYAGVINVTDVHQAPGRVGDLRPPLGRMVYIGLRADWPGEEE
jgi:outer membrane receptor for ferrienterochelin and colicins